MRVLQLSWEFPPHVVGGLGRHVADLSPALVAAGAQVHIVAPRLRNGAEHECLAPGLTVQRIATPYMEDYDFPSFVAQANLAIERAAELWAAEAGRPDLIHAHDWLAAGAGIALKHYWRIPLIATVHATERGRGRGNLNGWPSQQINDLEWRLSYEAWRVIVCSQFMAAQVGEYFATPPDKIDVISNGVTVGPQPFVSSNERAIFRRRFVADESPLVFSVGRIVYEKGLHILLDAWAQLADQRGARLVIAGTGPYLEALKSYALSLGLGNRVLFTGFITDADRDRLYYAADLAVFPSLYEPFGIVALEACAACCPVIVADTGGLREVIAQGATGLLVPADNPTALATALAAALDDPTAAAARAKHALAMIGERYTWPKIAVQTLAVYQRVLAEWNTNSWGKEIAPSS